MRLYVISRRGCFDFCHPNKESISTHIALYDDDNKKKDSINIDTEHELSSDENNVDNVIYCIDRWFKKIWYSTEIEHVKKFKTYIQEHADEITEGNRQFHLQQLIKQRNKIAAKIHQLEH